jgi:hypothetical protein
MFESSLQDDDTFPASGNLFAIGNNTGYFACGCKNGTYESPRMKLIKGLIFGKTELLRTAFEDAKPKTTASLKGGNILELPETPTHVRFTGDEESVIIAMPQKGVWVLDCNKLQQQVIIS